MDKAEALLKLIEIAEKDIEESRLVEQDEVFARIEKENPLLTNNINSIG